MSISVPSTSSPSTSLIEAPESFGDEPTVHPIFKRYICFGLTDSHTNYSRFFSALLVPQNSHSQLFSDLKQFREQPAIIYELHPATSENYRKVSRRFVSSRFAHPWCRIHSDFSNGWYRANSVEKRTTKEWERMQKEEERLHRLLVPIWIAMRRMFPGDQIVREWNQELERKAAERAEAKAIAAESKSEHSDAAPEVAADVHSELGFAIGSKKAPSTAQTQPEPPAPGAVEAASKMFLGVAVTGFLLSDKRVSKYMKKKLSKK